jgi:DNA-binding Xre family transcriptional regulator
MLKLILDTDKIRKIKIDKKTAMGKFTNIDLGKLMGVSPENISLLLTNNGKSHSLKTINRLGTALDVSPLSLIKEVDDEDI